MKNLFGFKTGKGFETFDESGENEASDDENRASNDKETPAGDAADVFVVEFLPVPGGRVEVVKEIPGEPKVHRCRETE